jgi:hypothetical protein
MGASFSLRFQADDQDCDKSEEQKNRQEPDPILQIKNRFKSSGIE